MKALRKYDTELIIIIIIKLFRSYKEMFQKFLINSETTKHIFFNNTNNLTSKPNNQIYTNFSKEIQEYKKEYPFPNKPQQTTKKYVQGFCVVLACSTSSNEKTRSLILNFYPSFDRFSHLRTPINFFFFYKNSQIQSNYYLPVHAKPAKISLKNSKSRKEVIFQ